MFEKLAKTFAAAVLQALALWKDPSSLANPNRSLAEAADRVREAAEQIASDAARKRGR